MPITKSNLINPVKTLILKTICYQKFYNVKNNYPQPFLRISKAEIQRPASLRIEIRSLLSSSVWNGNCVAYITYATQTLYSSILVHFKRLQIAEVLLHRSSCKIHSIGMPSSIFTKLLFKISIFTSKKLKLLHA